MQPFRLTVVAALLATSVNAGTALAQAPGAPVPQPPAAPGEIRGGVIDEAKGPVARATITVRTKTDSTVAAGAITGPDGTFRIAGLRPGRYGVRITSMGFRPHVADVAIEPANPRVALPAVTLTRIAVTLAGVQVEAEREAVTIEPDRNAYRAKDVAPAAANAGEVLEQVPSVQVDGEGKVSLRGNENVAVQINGRPSPLRGQQLASYLKSLPANVVDRVEVIPNPSAKYDPEGMAGIINITLKQNVDLGLSAGLNLGAANRDRYNGSGNVGWQSGPLTVFSSYGHFADARGVVGINDRERFDALAALRGITEQDVDERSASQGHNFYTSADYKLNARDLLTNTLTLNRRNATNDLLSGYTERDRGREIVDQYDRTRVGDIGGTMVDYALAFKRVVKPREHEVTSEVRFNRAHDEDVTTQWRLPLATTGGTNAAAVEGEIAELEALTQQVTGQLDWMRSFAKRTKLESGYKGTARWLDRDYLVRKDAAGNGTWARSDQSNDLAFDEQVHAAYAVLSHGIGKFDLQAGLRAEYASRDFSLAAQDARYPYDYGSLFPSAVALYNLNEFNQAKISYSRRVRRPGTQELNPFAQWMDAQNVFYGNPQLNPEYTDAIELGYTRNGKFGTLQVSPFLRHTTDVIRVEINTADVIDGREVTSVSFRNLATSNSWGTDLNGTLRLGSKYSGFAGFNVFKIVTDGGSASTLSSDAVAWSGRVNGTAQLTPAFMVQGSYFYRAPMKVERGRFAAQQGASLLLRQKVRGEAAAVTLRIQDPFNTNGFKIRAGDDNVIQITERNFGVRAAFVGFQYTYGQAPRIRQQPAQPQASGGGFPTGGP